MGRQREQDKPRRTSVVESARVSSGSGFSSVKVRKQLASIMFQARPLAPAQRHLNLIDDTMLPETMRREMKRDRTERNGTERDETRIRKTQIRRRTLVCSLVSLQREREEERERESGRVPRRGNDTSLTSHWSHLDANEVFKRIGPPPKLASTKQPGAIVALALALVLLCWGQFSHCLSQGRSIGLH